MLERITLRVHRDQIRDNIEKNPRFLSRNPHFIDGFLDSVPGRGDSSWSYRFFHLERGVFLYFWEPGFCLLLPPDDEKTPEIEWHHNLMPPNYRWQDETYRALGSDYLDEVSELRGSFLPNYRFLGIVSLILRVFSILRGIVHSHSLHQV